METKQAELSARLVEMEQRYLVLDRTETTTQRRIAELDEREERLRKEFEENERQLSKERQELVTLLAVVDRAGLRHRDDQTAD